MHNAIVYGQVMTEDSTGINRAKVMPAQYPEGCNKDSSYTALENEFTNESGSYRQVYHIGGRAESSCFKASVEFSDTTSFMTPEPKVFNVEFRSNPPYDSVRVDFVVQD